MRVVRVLVRLTGRHARRSTGEFVGLCDEIGSKYQRLSCLWEKEAEGAGVGRTLYPPAAHPSSFLPLLPLVPVMTLHLPVSLSAASDAEDEERNDDAMLPFLAAPTPSVSISPPSSSPPTPAPPLYPLPSTYSTLRSRTRCSLISSTADVTLLKSLFSLKLSSSTVLSSFLPAASCPQTGDAARGEVEEGGDTAGATSASSAAVMFSSSRLLEVPVLLVLLLALLFEATEAREACESLRSRKWRKGGSRSCDSRCSCSSTSVPASVSGVGRSTTEVDSDGEGWCAGKE